MGLLLGVSKKTSIQGIVAGVLIVVMSFAGLTGTKVPAFDPETNMVMRDANGDIKYTDPQPFDPQMIVMAIALFGIGRAARDDDVSSEGGKVSRSIK